ncbi:MAG: hypothetical protein ACK5MI_01650 [Mangrovibacterium sp.]
MKLKVRLIATLWVFLWSVSFVPQQVIAQDDTAQKESTKETVEDPTIQGQFNTLERVSTAYKEKGVAYRVVKFEALQSLQKNVSDSLQLYYAQDEKYQEKLNGLNTRLKSQTTEAAEIKTQLEEALRAENSVKLFGKYVPIATCKTIVWTVFIVLVILLVVVSLMFKRGYAQVRETKESLREVQEEFENHRKNALTREQKLARELMDVKIKNNLL